MKRFEQLEAKSRKIPLILKLDAAGHPIRWISYQEATVLSFNEKVVWELGQKIPLYGGINAESGNQSIFELSPILACNDQTYSRGGGKILLTNRTLFARDNYRCQYCGDVFTSSKLTRDHVTPVSRNGTNTWSNCTSACRRCNQRKDDRTPEEAGMQLLSVPYTPSPSQNLILQNRRILADQKEFLEAKIPKSSKYWS